MIQEKVYQIKLSHLIIGGILLLLLLYLIYVRIQPTPTPDYSKYKQKIEELQKEINRLKNAQDTLTIDLGKQQKVIDSLDNEVIETEKELIKTRLYYDKKIKYLTSSSPSELNDFFSKRYK
jgi:septal ring factor EnvC (AmiA/AmiB activator)